MREIKFRAWDEQSREMHYDFEFVSSGDKGDDWIIFKSNRQKLSSKPHPFENPWFKQQFEIMQFTGLHDKNGKEIYEGDILNTTCEKKHPGGGWICGSFGHHPENAKVVEWNQEQARWDLDFYRSLAKELQWKSTPGRGTDYEVLGNIFENPELLKVKK